jgi:phosphatidylserine/phosphatidylglycerophosphate/cardiolipin synthase-like enzyme
MKNALIGFGLLPLLAGCYPQGSIPQGVQVYFSPHGGATAAVVDALERATNTVLVQAYSFTSAPIARALVDAGRRGTKVQVILDKSQRTEKYSEADFLKNEGIPTVIDAEHAIAHNKIMIIDGYLVLTGSFNFTKAAEENNAENLLVVMTRYWLGCMQRIGRFTRVIRRVMSPGSVPSRKHDTQERNNGRLGRLPGSAGVPPTIYQSSFR